jgi:hypothetical protein
MTKRFQNYNVWLPALWLAIFVFIAYLPLSSFQFALKNDAFIYNFPSKKFFSDALRHGHIPFWNPYLNHGFPLYADPGFAWWHPLTWLFGAWGYTPYTFTIEVLIYIYIGSLGMYWLARQLKITRLTAFALGCMFSGSGFFIGNMQHINFLTSASFLPWLIAAWIKLQNNPSLKSALLAAIPTYLLCTAGHPAIPIATIYYMLVIAIGFFFFYRKEFNFKSSLLWNGCYLFFSLLLLFAPLLSWLQLMPYYERSESVDHIGSSHLGFSFPSYLSFLSPIPTIKNIIFFQTDVSMRNAYFSLLGTVSLMAVIIKNKNAYQKIFLISGICMLVLSFGGSVKQNIYSSFPLLNFIRTNGEFRVFAILSFTVSIGFFLDNLYIHTSNYALIKKLTKVVAITMSLMVIALFVVHFQKPEFSVSDFGDLSAGSLKQRLDELNFHQILLGAAISCLFFSLIYFFSFKYFMRIQFLYGLVMLDLVFHAWLLLPVTGVGSKSVSTLSAMLLKAPTGFPIPSLGRTTEVVPISPEDELRIGNWSWYDKQIVHKKIEYPSSLKGNTVYYNSGKNDFLQKPFVFLKNDKGSLVVNHFTPNKIELKLNLGGSDSLILLQNYYPGWKVFKNGNQISISLTKYNFLSIPVDTTDHIVQFIFSPF